MRDCRGTVMAKWDAGNGIEKYIEQLQHRIRELKVEIEHTRGQLQAWREMWQIYNR